MTVMLVLATDIYGADARRALAEAGVAAGYAVVPAPPLAMIGALPARRPFAPCTGAPLAAELDRLIDALDAPARRRS